MKKVISMLLITMILCSLLTVPALAEDAQGPAESSTEELTATMSVTGGTINPDGTVTWAVGENTLTITMSDGSTYTVTVIYDPESASPAALSTLTVSGTEIPMADGTAAAATPNASDTVAIVTEPADATVTINGTAVENGEATFDWAEGSNELAIEVSKEGYATTAYTLTVEYTPAKEEAAPEETTVPEETAAPEEATAPEAAAASEEAAAPEEVSPLAGLQIDGKAIDLDKFEKVSSTEAESNYSFNAAADAANDLTVSASTVEVSAADGWTLNAVKLNGANLTAVAAGSYSVQWVKANDLEITLKKADSDVKAVYSLILNNNLPEATADILTVNGADVSFLTAIQAAEDNSYSLQVSAGDGKAVAVSVNGVPASPDANGMLLVPAVTGAADSVVVTVSKEGCLNRTYSFNVSAVQVAADQAAGEPAADAAEAESAADDTADADAGVEETLDNTASPEIPV